VEKMSKSKGNYVGITESPDEMFRKLLLIGDELVFRYYLLLTDVSLQEIAGIRSDVQTGRLHPKQAKIDLAKRIVTDFHSRQAAEEAAARVEQVLAGGKGADTGDRISVHDWRLNRILVQTGLAASVKEADRLVKASAVSVAGAGAEFATIGNPAERIEPGNYTIRAGKNFKHIGN